MRVKAGTWTRLTPNMRVKLMEAYIRQAQKACLIFFSKDKEMTA